MFTQQDIPQVEKIAVIGVGPTGLAFISSLLEKAKSTPGKKYEITVIEKRSAEFTRWQRLVDIKPNVSWSEQSWESFINSSVRSSSADTNNIRQKFIEKFRKQESLALSRQVIVKNVSTKELQNALLEKIKSAKVDNVSINWNAETKVDKINLTEKTLITTTKSGDISPHEFDTLVVCEGAGHNGEREFVNQINRAIQDEKINVTPFHFEPFSHQLPEHNAAGLFTIKSANQNPGFQSYLKKGYVDNFKLSRKEAAKKIMKLGWVPPSEDVTMPMYILDNNLYKGKLGVKNWKPKIFVASEIPDAIAKINDSNLKQEKIKEWLTILISYNLQLPPDYFEIVVKKNNGVDVDAISAFDTLAQSVNYPALTLPNGAQVVLLGDCSLSSIYQAGISSGIGLNESIVAADCIVNTKNGSK